MTGTLQELRGYIPSIILKLYQRRLLDKTAAITTEEFLQAEYELAEQIKFLQYQQERVLDKQLILKYLIEKRDLMASPT